MTSDEAERFIAELRSLRLDALGHRLEKLEADALRARGEMISDLSNETAALSMGLLIGWSVLAAALMDAKLVSRADLRRRLERVIASPVVDRSNNTISAAIESFRQILIDPPKPAGPRPRLRVVDGGGRPRGGGASPRRPRGSG